jgi:hypothetical protein
MADSPLFAKTYDLVSWLVARTQQFPKSQRFVLAQRVRNAVLDFYDYLLEARKVDLNRRGEALLMADVELEKLRFYLRLCLENKLMNFRQYEFSSEQVVEIGRMLGAWRQRTARKLAEGQTSQKTQFVVS